MRTLPGRSDWVRCIALFQDGDRIVSGSHDDLVKIWDTILQDHPLR